MFAKYFCCHKYESFRKQETEEKRCVTPEFLQKDQQGLFITLKTTAPVEFYTVKLTTEVLLCPKCGDIKTIYY